MAYKRQSPTPIAEGGTNTIVMNDNNGTVYYDGSSLATTNVGLATQVLTSNGAMMAPTYQPSPTAGVISIFGSTPIAGVSPGRAFIALTTGISWRMPFGADASVGTQSSNQLPMPLAGTFSNLYVWVFSNSSTVDVTMTLNVNSVNSALVVTIPAGMTGTFSDTANSAAVVAGDFVQLEGSQAVTGDVYGMISGQFSS